MDSLTLKKIIAVRLGRASCSDTLAATGEAPTASLRSVEANLESKISKKQCKCPSSPSTNAVHRVGAHRVNGIDVGIRDEEYEQDIEDLQAALAFRNASSAFLVGEAEVVGDEDTADSDSNQPDSDCNLSTRSSRSLELVEARVLHEEEKLPSMQSPLCVRTCACLSLVVVTVAALTLSGVISIEDDTNQLAVAPNEAVPDPTPLSPFQEDLPLYLLKHIQDPHSPYSKANQWILQDPWLETYPQERQRQRFHMVSLYYALNGPDWTQNENWLDYEVSECEWFSQEHPDHNIYDDYPVCDDNSSLLKLNLAENNLRGELHEILQFIPTLRVWNMANNAIEGPYPISAQIPDIDVLIMSNNKFGPRLVMNGEVHIRNCRVLIIDDNNVMGHYGAFFKETKLLEHLNLSRNHFTGPITSNLGSCTKLKSLLMSDNEYEGSMPSELGALTDLETMDCSRNSLITGTLPTELGLLTKLAFLDITETEITGDVPLALCERSRDGTLVLKADCSVINCC